MRHHSGSSNGAAADHAATCPIGAASAATGMSAKMIRYYERVGVIRPAARSAANYRAYDPAALGAIRFVARARALGFPVADIRRMVALWRQPGRRSADVKAIARRHIAALDRRIAAMREMRAALAVWEAACPGDDGTNCPILDRLDADD